MRCAEFGRSPSETGLGNVGSWYLLLGFRRLRTVLGCTPNRFAADLIVCIWDPFLMFAHSLYCSDKRPLCQRWELLGAVGNKKNRHKTKKSADRIGEAPGQVRAYLPRDLVLTRSAFLVS
jgi:hypothetical protein